MASKGLYRALSVRCVSVVAELSAQLLRRFRELFCEIDHESSGRARGATTVPVLAIDSLEHRVLFASVTYGYGNLDIVGDWGAPNTISVTRSGSDVVAKVGSQSKNIPADWISRINITGGNSADSISIGWDISAPALIKGLGGNDYVSSGGGNDSIYGGDGNDTIAAGAGNDGVWGEGGEDSLDGGSGANSVDQGAGIVPSSTPTNTWAPNVTSLTLYNADTDQPIGTINNGATFSLATIGTPRLSILATLSNASSVRFGLNGNNNYRVESVTPFALNGDWNGDIAPWTAWAGTHTVSVTPFSGGGASGTQGATQWFSFTLTNSAPTPSSTPAPTTPTPTSGNSVNSFTLYNAATDQPIMTLNNGGTIDLAKTGTTQLSIVANVGSSTRSVKFGLDSNANYRIESAAPYAIAGDWSPTDLAPWTPSLGGHTLSATPYDASGATGSAGTTSTIWFNVVNSGATSGTGSTPSTSTPTTPTTTTPPPTTNYTAGGPNVSISVKDNTINAGAAAFVNGLATSLNAGDAQTARFEWDFGDWGSRHNNLVGWNAAHVYDKPGTYNVTLRVTNEAGKTNSATTQVYVAGANRNQIYVSAWSGNDANPGTWDRPIRTFDRARNMVSDNTEVLFKRGETFTMGTPMYLIGRKNVLIGAYGSGDRPVLKYDGGLWLGSTIFTTGPGSDGITFQDLVIDSRYTDPNTYEGMPAAIQTGGVANTIRNVEFRNVADAILGNKAPSGLYAYDNSAPMPLRGYFAWVQGSDHVYVGNTAVDSLYQHVLRQDGADRVLIANNNFTNRNTSIDKGALNIHEGNHTYITGNTLPAGKLSIGPLGQGDGLSRTWARMKYVVAENNRVSGLTLVQHGSEHVTLRNNIFHRDGDVTIQMDGYSSQYGRGVSDVTIANNTSINNSTKGNFLRVGGDVDGINLVNNLYIAHNLVTGSEGSAPVSVWDTDLSSFRKITNNVWPSASPIVWAQGGINYAWTAWSEQQGYKTPAEWEAFGQVIKDYYEDTGYSGNLAPYTSTIAANAAIPWYGVMKDFFGNTRPASGSMTAGAIEV